MLSQFIGRVGQTHVFQQATQLLRIFLCMEWNERERELWVLKLKPGSDWCWPTWEDFGPRSPPTHLFSRRHLSHASFSLHSQWSSSTQWTSHCLSRSSHEHCSATTESVCHSLMFVRVQSTRVLLVVQAQSTIKCVCNDKAEMS